MLMRGNPLISEHQSPITEVLLICRCGRVKTQCLDGHWTLEQLQPKQSSEADKEFLRTLGVKL